MIEDERQYEIAESETKKKIAFDPDAKLKALYAQRGKNFLYELSLVDIRF